MTDPAQRYGIACLVLLAVLACGVFAEDDGKPDQPNTRFIVNLADGSSINCKPLAVALPIKTSYAELSIPFHRLRKVELDHEKNKAKIKFMNGDIIQGSCPLEALEIETLLGKITIAMKHVTDIVSVIEGKPPPPVYHDSPEKRNRCINNLRIIDSAFRS